MGLTLLVIFLRYDPGLMVPVAVQLMFDSVPGKAFSG